MSKYRFSIVACARWEENYIQEWVLYYKNLGFDHIYLYCNDDFPYTLLEKLSPFLIGQNPFVTFYHHKQIGQQFDMYLHFIINHINETEYVSFFDIDEFLWLSNGRNISEFINDINVKCDRIVDVIYFNWLFFGNNGNQTRPPGLVLENYYRRESGFSNFMTKHITRSEKIKNKYIEKGAMTDFWHYWNGVKNFKDFDIVNALGEDARSYYSDIEQTKINISDNKYFDNIIKNAVLCHFAFKSKEDFLLRARRSVSDVFAQQADHEKAYYDGRADAMLAHMNAVDDYRFRYYWKSFYFRVCNKTEIDLRNYESGSLISNHCRAIQSTTSEWSCVRDLEQDASGALNGVIDGRAKFHTDLEDAPWWRVDLGVVHGIREVRLFNRMDQPAVAERANRIAIDIGFDPEHFIEVFRRESDEPFGGVDGNPLVFAPSIPIPGRFVRVRLLERNYLHLDQVEVYGDVLAQFG